MTKAKFLLGVADLKLKWYLDPNGRLRTVDGGRDSCPITALANDRGGRFMVNEPSYAGKELGLRESLVDEIVGAADNWSEPYNRPKLRSQLLSACNTQEREP